MPSKFDRLIQSFQQNISEFPAERVLATNFQKRAEEKEKLLEGLQVSYGSTSLKSQFFSNYKSDIIFVEDVPLFADKLIEPKFGRPNTLTFIFKNDFKPDSNFYRILSLCGYFIVKEERDYNFDGKKTYFCQLEPKFPIEVHISNPAVKFLHVTKKNRLDKIFQIGLTPKESQTTFKHPGNRIYLFASKHPELYIESLKSKLGLDKGIESSSLITLEVDSNFVRNNYLFIDESFEHKADCVAVFVLKNIPSSYIRLYE